MRRLCLILLLFASSTACARVDTLRSVAAVDDATIYNFLDCTTEMGGENCRRFNTGAVTMLKAGTRDVDDHRIVMRFPGWDRSLPDSAVLELTCTGADDAEARRIFAYPLTRRFFEGTEVGAGAYPEPDSGVTWNHVWLDVGDLDSLPWTTPGGDYSNAVACTVTVSAPGVYRVRPFGRILSWWNSNSADPGVVLINQNVFPANTAMKTFASSEDLAAQAPRLLLYYGDEPVEWTGRRHKVLTGAME